ncbi:hypothetical protein AB1Y20_021968 [Prymnesium parvum]|uniref:Peroxisomal membrane protein PEX16 n=1 Tax=Prymnesium parvum TaxID=97485 RepID=A0AB34JI52_PRYPA
MEAISVSMDTMRERALQVLSVDDVTARKLPPLVPAVSNALMELAYRVVWKLDKTQLHDWSKQRALAKLRILADLCLSLKRLCDLHMRMAELSPQHRDLSVCIIALKLSLTQLPFQFFRASSCLHFCLTLRCLRLCCCLLCLLASLPFLLYCAA